MGPILPPPTRTVKDADSFADDKVGADKAKREQTKKAAEEGAKKSRSAELAKKVQQVQEAQFADGRDDTGKAKRVDQGRESKGPQLKPGQQGGPATRWYQDMGSAERAFTKYVAPKG